VQLEVSFARIVCNKKALQDQSHNFRSKVLHFRTRRARAAPIRNLIPASLQGLRRSASFRYRLLRGVRPLRSPILSMSLAAKFGGVLKASRASSMRRVR
jgi:hypothetical protein